MIIISTRSYIAKKIGEDAYLTIYCHVDGYLTYNGAMLLDHYNTPERVDALLALGDLSSLQEKVEPDPNLPHSFNYDERQKGVTVAYGCDRGETGTEARVATLADLNDESNWTEYVYVFDENNQWKYFKTGQAENGLRDVGEDLEKEYQQYGMQRPSGYYGFLDDEIVQYLKSKAETNEEHKDAEPSEFDFTDEDVADMEIMCAKHTLWLYEGNGEKLDLSGKKLLNIDFSNKDICGADLSNAVFVNCSFKNTSLCSANVQNAELKNCNLKRVTAEESNFAESKFIDCNLSSAFFTHSNFKSAEIIDSDVQGADFSSSCMEGVDTDGTDLYAAITSNCSYDESEWLGKQEGEEDQGMTMGGM